LVSVNVGTPREIGLSRGKKTISAIYKKPVQGPVFARRFNLDGDWQGDPSVHGGEDAAVYAYPSEHYGYWKEIFPKMEMPWGTFGENFTTEGLLEDGVHVGDQFAVGTAKFQITKPRFPCFKLGMRFGTQRMVKLFLDSERSGFYLRVLLEGQVKAGDEIRPTGSDQNSGTIASIVRVKKKTE
jgi:MOSC domain-containing protein YiiM